VMAGTFRHFLSVFLSFGALGLVVLGILDSSFLFLPFGNDLLLVILVARDHSRMLLYAAAASLGSATGIYLLDIVTRKGGEKGLERLVSRKRLEYLKARMQRRAGPMLFIACVAPPPFPFTAVIAAASAFQYPRRRLLTVTLASRLVRFVILGIAAIAFGRRVLRFIDSTSFIWFMGGFSVIYVVGSVISVIKWIRHSRAR
jgi:membrane protein YqaA with SNARE-associated domain